MPTRYLTVAVAVHDADALPADGDGEVAR